MIEIGTIVRGRELGYKHESDKVIWSSCVVCGKERWVVLIAGKARDDRCASCARKANRTSDRKTYKKGYSQVWLHPDNFFYPMATILRSNNGGYVLEHRLVVAKSLGRCLNSWELIHHINGDKSDNRIENLQIVMQGQHKQITILENRIRVLENRVTILEVENIFLKDQRIYI